MKRYDGMNHGFFTWPGVVDKAGAAIDEACVWVKSLWHNVPMSPR